MKVSWIRSNAAQINAMSKRWPSFELVGHDAETVFWKGPVRGAQKKYLISIVWIPKIGTPLVSLIDPTLQPRFEGSYDEIPHLYFNNAQPEKSYLCLFNGKNEWNGTMLIADTIVPWAGRWLFYYELWLHDGIWRGGGVGYESIAAARANSIYQ